MSYVVVSAQAMGSAGSSEHWFSHHVSRWGWVYHILKMHGSALSMESSSYYATEMSSNEILQIC